jgi:hypothetical protein
VGRGTGSRTTSAPTLRSAAMTKRGSKDLEAGEHEEQWLEAFLAGSSEENKLDLA